jgi:hypothetical protein
MKKRARTAGNRGDLDTASLRLLEALTQSGAYAWSAGGDEAAPVKAVAPRNGVSVQIGSFPEAAGAALVSCGLANWRGEGRPRLYLNEAGRAKYARLATPEDIDPFTGQHARIERESVQHDEGVVDAIVNTAESPLAWLARRKGRDGRSLVDAAGLEAGERLRRDLTFAAMLPRVTANWEASGSDPAYHGLTYSDRVVAARQRVASALDAVGPEFSGLLMDVCGFLKGLETVEAERGWPVRSAKVILALALQRLARHYGYASVATGAVQSSLRHWGAADFRPEAGVIEPAADA